MKCPKCDSKNVIEISNLHSLWSCGECGFQGDGSEFDRVLEARFEIRAMAYRATGDPTGNRFSRACSALLRIQRSETEGYNDIAAFKAPSECNRDVRNYAESEAVNKLAQIGYTDPVEFVIEYHRRLDGKQAYDLGLDAVLPRHIQWEGWDKFIGSNVSAIC